MHIGDRNESHLNTRNCVIYRHSANCSKAPASWFLLGAAALQDTFNSCQCTVGRQAHLDQDKRSYDLEMKTNRTAVYLAKYVSTKLHQSR